MVWNEYPAHQAQMKQMVEIEAKTQELEALGRRLKTELAFDPPADLVREALDLFDPRLLKLVA